MRPLSVVLLLAAILGLCYGYDNLEVCISPIVRVDIAQDIDPTTIVQVGDVYVELCSR